MNKLLFVLLATLLGCVQKPPVVSNEPPPSANDRPAIAVDYVAVPSMVVYARPGTDSPIVGKYGYNEAIPVLTQNGDWCEIRMFDGTGWVRTSDLIDPAKAKELAEIQTPRFYVMPKVIPYRASGEIVMQAKVNTEGEVIDVKTIKNTTGVAALEKANETALRESKFYPIVEKGARKMFVYEHRVFY